jgi:glutamate 5-kinase
VVSDLDSKVCDITGKSSSKGVGGLKTKIDAAKTATGMGIPVVVANSTKKEVLERIVTGKNEGTIFLPQRGLDEKKHWIKFTAKSKGKISVDKGAQKVLLKGSSSLLPVGVSKVSGLFEKGDTIDITGPDGKVFAKGVTNYSSLEINKIKGFDSRRIEEKLGYCKYREVVFRDNMVLL